MRRPLILVAISFLGGILLAHLIPISPFPVLVVAIALWFIAIVWSKVRAGLLVPVFILAGWVDMGLHTAALSPNDLRILLGGQAHLAAVRGNLTETPTIRVFEQEEKLVARSLARLDVTAIRMDGEEWRPATGRVAVSTPGELTNIFGGQVVEVSGVVSLPEIAVAEGTFDYRAYLNQLGIYYRLKANSEKDWQVIVSPPRRPIADRFRDWARKTLALGLPCEDETVRLEWALTLGWKQALTEEVSEPFVRAATYHIFAVDGLRMAIVFGIFFSLLRSVGIPRWLCGLLLLPMIWFYVALTGWPASAIRATVMLSIIIVGWVLRRPSDLLNSLFAAAFIILVWEPQQLFQAGFQLSFLVVLCLILIIPVLQETSRRLFASDPLLPDSLRPRWRKALRPPLRFLEGLTITSFAAWIGSIPLVAYYFNIITPVSTPANILAVPLCGLVLICNLSSLILAGWLPGAAQLFNHGGWFLMKCIQVSSDWFAELPRAYMYTSAPNLFTMILYYCILLGLLTGWLLKPQFRFLKVATLMILATIWMGNAWLHHSARRLTVLTEPSGYSIFVNGGRADNLLFDCGTTNAVQTVIKPYLRAQGVNRLPALILTVGHVSQSSGAPWLVELFDVQKVFTSTVRYQSALHRATIRQLSEQPERVKTLSRGETIGQWKVIHPDANESFSSADDKPLVLSGKINNTRILLVSNLSPVGQEALLERNPALEADIVVSGLPTRPEAVSDRFLHAVRPRLVVISDSTFPARARANVKLRARLARANIPIIYTASEGATSFEFHDRFWTARTMSGLRIDSRTLAPLAPVPDDGGDSQAQ